MRGGIQFGKRPMLEVTPPFSSPRHPKSPVCELGSALSWASRLTSLRPSLPSHNHTLTFGRYSLALVADQATEPDRWTSMRLRREALYLESRHRRFELVHKAGQGSDGFDRYSLSEVLRPYTDGPENNGGIRRATAFKAG